MVYAIPFFRGLTRSLSGSCCMEELGNSVNCGKQLGSSWNGGFILSLSSESCCMKELRNSVNCVKRLDFWNDGSVLSLFSMALTCSLFGTRCMEELGNSVNCGKRLGF